MQRAHNCQLFSYIVATSSYLCAAPYRDSVTRIVFKLRLWSDRIPVGPTNVPELLFEFFTLPLICYNTLKMAPIEVRLMTSSSQAPIQVVV